MELLANACAITHWKTTRSCGKILAEPGISGRFSTSPTSVLPQLSTVQCVECCSNLTAASRPSLLHRSRGESVNYPSLKRPRSRIVTTTVVYAAEQKGWVFGCRSTTLFH